MVGTGLVALSTTSTASITRAQTLNGEVVLHFNSDPNLEQLEREYLRQVMAKYGGNRQKTAAVLGISERNIYRLIEKYGFGSKAET